MTWGGESVVADAARSRYILNFGANPFESGDQHTIWRRGSSKGGWPMAPNW